MSRRFVPIFTMIVFCMTALSSRAENGSYDGTFGWPLQQRPSKVLVCSGEGLAAGENMLLESLSGLAAKAVNEGRWNTMVWIKTSSPDYKYLYEKSVEALGLAATDIEEISLWDLVDKMRKKRLVKGYVLYDADQTEGPLYAWREGIDCSSNVATVYCSLLDGMLIERNLQEKAKSHHLRLLKDVKGETMEECFHKNKSKLNNDSAIGIDPKVSNCRDIAIAQKLMVYYGTGKFYNEVLEWVRPLSPIMGWNCGNEDEFTEPISLWGHYNTASNWCLNLPFLSAAGRYVELKKLPQFNPAGLEYDNDKAYHTVMMSDGDNLQWVMGDFSRNPLYFGNENRSETNMSWTLCATNVSVMSPLSWNYLVENSHSGETFVEYGGGYQYPDKFAQNRPNRKELLREFAKRLNYHFNKLGITVFGCICKDARGADALEAFQIYAEEIENLAGILPVQYYPYELGGEVLWVNDKDGNSIPVITARYCIWEKTLGREFAGTPDYISAMINRDVMAGRFSNVMPLSWTIVNAWSGFEEESKAPYYPNKGCNVLMNIKSTLRDEVQIIPAEELVWRTRMRYNPEQTQNILNEIQ